MATDPTTLPTIADIQQSKKDMEDITEFNASESNTFIDNYSRTRKTLTGIENEADTVINDIQSEGDAAIADSDAALAEFAIDSDAALAEFAIDSDAALAEFAQESAEAFNEFDLTLDQYKESRGFNTKGTFAGGFTYAESNDVGIDASGDPWIYNGVLPFTVTAGTTPTSPTYTQVVFGSAAQVSMNTSDTVQSFADSFALKIFQSPTDGGLTEIQTRTIEAGEVYEVRKTYDDSLATIYSDAASPTEILQNGTDNKSGSDGVVGFYIADGDYYVGVDSVKSNFIVVNANSIRISKSLEKIIESTPVVGKKFTVIDLGGAPYDVVNIGDSGGVYLPLNANTKLRLVFSDKIETNWLGLGSGSDDSVMLSQLGGFANITVVGDKTKTYTLEGKVNITADNHTLDFNGGKVRYTGAGADNIFNAALNIKGELSTTTANCTEDVIESSNKVTLDSVAGFSVGDIIQVDSLSVVVFPDLYLLHSFKVVDIVGNTLHLDSPFAISADYTLGIVVTKVNAVVNSHIKGVSEFTADDQTSRSNGISACMGTYTSECSICDIKAKEIWFKCAIFQLSHKPLIKNPTLIKPTGVGGGEGYCSQLSYCTQGKVVKPVGYSCRHTFDASASWSYKVIGGEDHNSKSGGYINHNAYERWGGFIACTSNSPQAQGFALGSTNGFGKNAGDMYLESSHVYNAQGGTSALTYTAKDMSGLKVVGCTFEMSPSTGTQAVTTSQSDVDLTSCKLDGGIQLTSGGDIKSDGYAKLTSCEVLSGSGRSIVLTQGMRLDLSSSTIKGRADLAANTTVNLNSSDWYRDGGGFWNTTNNFAEGQIVKLTGGSNLLCPDDITSNTTLLAQDLIFDNSNYTSISGTTYFYVQNLKVSNGSEIQARAIVGNEENQELDVVGSEFKSYNQTLALRLLDFSGKVKIVTSKVTNVNSSSNDAITVESGSTITDIKIVASSFLGDVVIPDAYVDKCYIVGNDIDASATILPTPSSNKIVENNY